jgi:kynurenine formamidase
VRAAAVRDEPRPVEVGQSRSETLTGPWALVGHERCDVAGKAVLVHTGWDRHWRTDRYFESHPFLTGDAAEHLVSAGALFVGIDSLNIDDTPWGGERPVHTRCWPPGSRSAST